MIWKHTYNIYWSLLKMWGVLFGFFLKKRFYVTYLNPFYGDPHETLIYFKCILCSWWTSKRGHEKRMDRHLFPSVPLDLCVFLMSSSSNGLPFRTPERQNTILSDGTTSRHLCNDLLVLVSIWGLMVKAEFAATLNTDEVRNVVLNFVQMLY